MKKIDFLPQLASAQNLEDGGIMPSATHGTSPTTRSLSSFALDVPGARSGVWECTPGRFTRATPNAEMMHFISGKGTFTPAGGEAIQITAGDTLVVPAHTEGTWVVEQTIRKIFVTLDVSLANQSS